MTRHSRIPGLPGLLCAAPVVLLALSRPALWTTRAPHFFADRGFCGGPPLSFADADTLQPFTFAWLVSALARVRMAVMPTYDPCAGRRPVRGPQVLPVECFRPLDGGLGETPVAPRWRANGSAPCETCPLGIPEFELVRRDCLLHRFELASAPGAGCTGEISALTGRMASRVTDGCALMCSSARPGSVHFGMEYRPAFRDAAAQSKAEAAHGPAGARAHEGIRRELARDALGSDPLVNAELLRAGGPAERAPPSFVLVPWDASPKWVLEKGLRDVAEQFACPAGQRLRTRSGRRGGRHRNASHPAGEQRGDRPWVLHRFHYHNSVALNTYPNMITLLTGFRPPNTVIPVKRMDFEAAKNPDVRRGRAEEAFDQLPYNDTVACIPAMSSSHYCTGPLADRMPQVLERYDPLHRAAAATHVRSHSVMWRAPQGEGPAEATILQPARQDPSYMPEHVAAGPFPNPRGYGEDRCTHPAIAAATEPDRRCLNERLLMRVQHAYNKRFHLQYRHVPTLSVDLHLDTHDFWDAVRQTEADWRDFFATLAEHVAPVKDLFVIFTSDHGPHNDHFKGKEMHSHIALWILAPRRFAERFPQEAANLRRATMTGTHHRDVYWTIRDLIWLYTGAERRPIPDGSLSLIRPTPGQRSCSQAGLVADYCHWPTHVKLP